MLFYHMVVATWLVVISILDIKSRRVPLWLLAVGGMIALPVIGWCNGIKEYWDVLKGMLPGVSLLAVAFFTGRAGYGDGIVLLLLGVVSKGKGVLLFGISLFLISIFSVVLLTFRKADRNTPIPYIPFLAVAWLLTINS